MAFTFTHDEDSVTVIETEAWYGAALLLLLHVAFGLFFIPGHIDTALAELQENRDIVDSVSTLFLAAWAVAGTLYGLFGVIATHRKSWIFTSGRIEYIVTGALGDRRRVWNERAVKAIVFRHYDDEGTLFFSLNVRLSGGKVLKLPQTRDRDERNDVAKLLEAMFPDAKINWFKA
ncbi:hypothetical protein [Asticcacaulis solisilvae]|uniref:hypothetical protein n=1 Tax=Asticcacaulis solisilvae TaxID=1217274 RepID=UPI003FD773A7